MYAHDHWLLHIMRSVEQQHDLGRPFTILERFVCDECHATMWAAHSAQEVLQCTCGARHASVMPRIENTEEANTGHYELAMRVTLKDEKLVKRICDLAEDLARLDKE